MATNMPGILEWEAPEHHHIEKGADWYWALGIVTVAAVVTAVFFGNVLFAIVLGLSGLLIGVVSLRGPIMVTYAITPRGIRVDETLFPYSTLESFHIDEEDPRGPQLLVKSQRSLMPLIVMPLMTEDVEVVDDILAERLPEEHLEEPLAHRLLEFLGF